MNHTSIFFESCLVFCETSLLVKFSQIAFKNVENAAISILTFVCFDVGGGDVLWVSVLSSIDK